MGDEGDVNIKLQAFDSRLLLKYIGENYIE